MFVPAFLVLSFNFIKKPVISALWYAILAHFLLQPFSNAAIIVSSAFLAISFSSIRYYMAIVSPAPMILSLVLCLLNYAEYFIYFFITAVIWSILCIIALIVTLRMSKGIYYIDPVTGIMYKK